MKTIRFIIVAVLTLTSMLSPLGMAHSYAAPLADVGGTTCPGGRDASGNPLTGQSGQTYAGMNGTSWKCVSDTWVQQIATGSCTGGRDASGNPLTGTNGQTYAGMNGTSWLCSSGNWIQQASAGSCTGGRDASGNSLTGANGQTYTGMNGSCWLCQSGSWLPATGCKQLPDPLGAIPAATERMLPAGGTWISINGSSRPTTMEVISVYPLPYGGDITADLAALKAAGLTFLMQGGWMVAGILLAGGSAYIVMVYAPGLPAQAACMSDENALMNAAIAYQKGMDLVTYCSYEWAQPTPTPSSSFGLEDANGNPRYTCSEVRASLADIYAHRTPPAGMRGIWIPELVGGSHPHGFVGGYQYTTWNLVDFLMAHCPNNYPRWGLVHENGESGTLIP